MPNRIIKILIIVTVAMPFFLFAGSLSAQDNYTVVVKCYPVATNGTGTITVSSGWLTKKIGGNYVYTYDYTSSAGDIEVSLKNTANFYAEKIGWMNFNISGIPTNATITKPPSVYLWPKGNSYGSNALTISFANNVFSTISFPTNSRVSFETTGMPNSTGAYASVYNYSTFVSTLLNYNFGSGVFYSSNTGSYNSFALNDWISSTLTSSRAAGITSFLLGVRGWWNNTASTFQAYGSNESSRKPFLAVCYAAPWSVTQSVKTSSTDVCANSRFTLSAGATIQNDVTYTPVSWQWYSATASNGDYSPMGSTNQSTYAAMAPSNTGSVWYKFCRTINVVTNAINSATANYSFTNCNTASVLVSQCCTSLGSNPTFSATQVSDRSVTLNWSGMNHVDHFVIRYGVEGGISYNEITVAGNDTSKTIERLTNGRTYYFQIQAIGASGYCDTQLSDKTYLAPNCN